jgi:allantoate deiminase
LTIDGALVTAYLNRLYEIGTLPEGGVWRPVYTPAWDEARHVVRGWMADAGLTVREDAVGNLFGRLEGAAPAPIIMVGSHIDSVYAGGRLDGALGVVGAIAAVRSLRARFPWPDRTVEVFVSCEEEDSRFICDFWGSRALLGQIRPEEAASYRDAEGIVLADAMRTYSLDPDHIPTATRTDIGACVELHIEQGPVLDREGIALGVVETISGVNRTRVRVRGRADHAGTTPMAMRADPLLASAQIIVAMRELALSMGEPARVSVCALHVFPNQANVVAGTVECIVDSRHPNRATQRTLLETMAVRCREIAAAQGVEVQTDVLVDQEPTAMDPGLIAVCEHVIQRRGWTYRRMVSGAGHDSQILGRQIPTVMLFVPSRDGRSHSPAEYTPPEQVMVGVQALAGVVEELACAPKHAVGT